MNNLIFEKLIYFVVGGAAGSLVTAFFMKRKHDEQMEVLEEELDKYENHMDEEVKKMRKAILEGCKKDERDSDKYDDQADNDPDEDTEKLKKISNNIANRVKKAKEKPDMKNIIEKNGYRDELEDDEFDDEEEEDDTDDTDESPFIDEIEIIAPEEFGEYRDYDKEHLFYLRDRNLVDDQGNIIEDVDSVVGYDSLSQFGEYDDNHVYVRNHQTKTDFDIFRDTKHTFKNFKD